MTRRGRINYGPTEMQWLSDNRAMVISDYHRGFCAAFARSDVAVVHLHALRKRKGWKVGRVPGRFAGRRRLFSPAEVKWLRDNCTLPSVEYLSGFRVAFGRDEVTAGQLKTLRKSSGWKTGRTGHFAKGVAPWSKGKKRPFNAGSARTQFKKGHPRSGKAYKPIGSERMHRSGYRTRKIHDGFPMQSRWKFIHLIEWEAVNGPVPEGMVLKCKGDRLDTDPANWELMPRGMLPRLNNRWGRNYDGAAEELKPTIMAVAKLEHRIREKSRARGPS